MNTPCNSCERLVEALKSCLDELWDDWQSHNNRETFESYFEWELKALTTSQQPSPQPVPPSVVTVDRFNYLISHLGRAEIAPMLRDCFTNGLKLSEDK